MKSLYERIGGAQAIAHVVDDFYDRLTQDPRVLHHFDKKRLPSLKAGQCTWIAHTLGGPVTQPVPDLRQAHASLEITDEQVAAVVTHLDQSLEAAGVDTELRRQVMSLVARLWFARSF